MYEVIKHYFKKWFSSTATEKDVLMLEYQTLLNELRHAKTLSQLFNVRSKISLYITDIQHIGSPSWGKRNIHILNTQWNKYYRMWKKLRG